MKAVIKITLCFIFIFFNTAQAQDFTSTFKLEILTPFLPGKSINLTKKEMQGHSVLTKDGEKIIFLTRITSDKFFLTATVQIEKGIVLDGFFRFPNNFSHDRILELLQKNFGKQSKYYKQGNQSLYFWNDKDLGGEKVNLIYHGACSISCFPMGIFVIGKKSSENPSFISLYKKFNDGL